MNGVLHGDVAARPRRRSRPVTNRPPSRSTPAAQILTVMLLVMLYLMVFKPGF